MKLNNIIIYVDDVNKAVNFYQKAFNLDIRFVHESHMYAEMETGQTALSFAHHSMHVSGHLPTKSEKNHQNFDLAFVSEDVVLSFEKAIKNKAIIVTQPQEKPWGQTVAFVEDIFGNLIEICSPLSM